MSSSSIYLLLQSDGTSPCVVIRERAAGDQVDNDCDGRVDEENCDPDSGMNAQKRACVRACVRARARARAYVCVCVCVCECVCVLSLIHI